MGACSSNLTPEEQEASRRNREISKQLKRDREKQSVKLLLLGTGISASISAEGEIYKLRKLEPKNIFRSRISRIYKRRRKKLIEEKNKTRNT